jgi:hypothetical protein
MVNSVMSLGNLMKSTLSRFSDSTEDSKFGAGKKRRIWQFPASFGKMKNTPCGILSKWV